MTSLIAKLQELAEPGMIPEETDLLREVNEICDQLQKVSSFALIDRLCDLRSMITALEADAAFARGFTLGVQLLLEAMSSPL